MPNNYILLETIALTQSAASVTFDNLPTSGYTDLKIVMSVRNTTATTVGNVTLDMQINGLTTGYTGKQLYGSGTSVGSLNRNNVIIGTLNSANDTANTFSNIEVYIPNYRSSNAKSYSVDSVSEGNTTVTELDLLAKLNSTTSPITSITFLCSFDSFAANSTFSLYGIAALGTTPVLAPKAYGGNRIENDGTYWIHTFTSSGNFIPQTGLSCEYVALGGGSGGGGGTAGVNYGAAGAGGIHIASTQTFASGSIYSLVVGAGGAGAVATTGAGTSSSITGSGITTVTATGGNAAGTGSTGASNASFTGGTGAGTNGGAGAGAGGNGSGSNGGVGVTSSISGSSVGRGGGGAGWTGGGGGVSGTAVDGGGLANSGAGAAGNGATNRGAGGGGNGGIAGGSGGSGVILIRYPIA